MLKSELLATEDLPLCLYSLILKQNSHPTEIGIGISMRYIPHSSSRMSLVGDELGIMNSAVENSAEGCSWISATITSSHSLFRVQNYMSLHRCLCFWAQATTCKGCKRDVGFLLCLTDSLEPFSLCIYPGCPETAKSHPEQVKGVIEAVGRFYTDARVVTNLKRKTKNIWLTLIWVQRSSEGLIFYCVMVSAFMI